jgi:hypothetical protein
VEASARIEIMGLVMEHGRPVKDEEWVDDEWRDFDWPHSEAGCPGWRQTKQSELVIRKFQGWGLYTITHCICECRVHPHVTLGLEGTVG